MKLNKLHRQKTKKRSRKCQYCGKSRFTLSTELKDGKWITKKICENCGKVVKTDKLKKRKKVSKKK